MRIFPIKFNRINFSSTDRTVYFDKQDGRYSLPNYTTDCYDELDRENSTKMVYSNRTFFFRKDLPWRSLPAYLSRQFKDTKKVNVYNFACSDGSEPYSLVLSFINDLGEEGAKKFFPIIASDVDEKIIQQAKAGAIKATSYDVSKIEAMIYPPKTINDFFVIERNMESPDYPFVLHPKEILSKNVQFKCQSIEEGLDEVEKSNSLILARNFWRYLSPEELASASLKLRKSIDATSRVVIGDFDKMGDTLSKQDRCSYGNDLPMFLRYLGFRPVDWEPCNPYENILKVSQYHDTAFLYNPALWLEQVKQDYNDYKLPYGIH